MNASKDVLRKAEPAKPRKGWRDFTHVDTRRSIVLFAVGAVIGLILAGFALFTAKGTSTLVVPPEDVALVNQQPIARSDFYLQLKALYSTDYAHTTREQRKTVLDQMIREELFVQRGKELDVASTDPDVRVAMVSAVEQGIAADVVASKPSDEKLMAYYKAHQETYSTLGRMTLQDLVFPTPEAAASASQALNMGGEPGAVAAQYHGKDTKRVNGEEFYFAAKIHLGDVLFAAARPLQAKQASKPIAQPDGAHVIYMVSNITPQPNSFADARSQVLADYEKEAIDRLQKGDANFFRKRANVLIAPDMR